MKLIYVKRTFKTPWEERESRFDIQKSFIPVCGRWEDSCMTPFGQVLLFFLLCLKSNFYFGNWKCQKLFSKGYGFVTQFELDNYPTKFHNHSCKFSIQILLPTKFFRLANRWHSFEMQMMQKILCRGLYS